jgi:hypothetical protein
LISLLRIFDLTQGLDWLLDLLDAYNSWLPCTNIHNTYYSSQFVIVFTTRCLVTATSNGDASASMLTPSCLCVYMCIPLSLLDNGSVKIPLSSSRQQLDKTVTAATNTHATIEELLDASFSMRFVSYQGRQTVSSSQIFLTRVEAGSNTSTVTLRVVRGHEKGSLKSETVKYGRES